MAKPQTVRVDREACQGHALCMREAPEIFDIDDEGLAFTLVDVVPSDQLEAAQAAERACPEMAITLTEG